MNHTFTSFTGLGFIVANVPGFVLGAVAGNRIGAVRDAKGKSVAAVFSELGASQKAEVCLKYISITRDETEYMSRFSAHSP